MSILKITLIAHLATLLFIFHVSNASAVDDLQTCKTASGDEAIAACSRLIESGKVSSELRAEIYDKRGVAFYLREQYSRAISDYNEAIRLAPKNATFWSHRGYAFQRDRQYERALSDFSENIRINPTPYNYNSRCRLRMNFGRELRQALADCNTADGLKSNDYNILFSRGEVQIKLGNYAGAIADFDAALKLDAAYKHMYLYGRGLAKTKKGDTAGGSADIAAAKAIKPDVVKEYAEDGF